jgi:hypothetical protein
MPQRAKILLVVVTLLASSLACVTVMSESPIKAAITEQAIVNPTITEEPPTKTPTEAPLTTCPDLTNKIIDISTAGGGGVENNAKQETLLVTYTVSGDKISDPQYEKVKANLKAAQNDTTKQRQTWNYFSALIPAERRKLISEYSAMTDGRDGALAAVVQTQSDPNLWALEVDVADSADYYSLTFTLVHEFGHLLTLGPDQVPPNLAVFNNPEDNAVYLDAVSACPQYFPGEGCAKPASYINAFYNQYWADIHDEWNAINLIEDETTRYDRLDKFYSKYQDRFVTDYSATNPEEDMAETWSFFALGPKPAGDTIAEEKILFFYKYPELVQLRAQILNNLCASFPK